LVTFCWKIDKKKHDTGALGQEKETRVLQLFLSFSARALTFL